MVKMSYNNGCIEVPLNTNNKIFSIRVDNSINIKSFAKLFVEYKIMYKLSEPKYTKHFFGLIKSKRIPKPDSFIFKSDKGCMVVVLSYMDKNLLQITTADENVIEYEINNKEFRELILNVYQQCLGYVESMK